MKGRVHLLPILCCLALAACDVGLNRSVTVPDGEKRSKSINVVNGNITLGRDVTMRGSCRTVNGNITIGNGSRVSTLESVNGSIRIGENVTVDDQVRSINGPIEGERGATFEDDIQSINGPILLVAAKALRDIRTFNGPVTLEEGTTVRGNIIVERTKSQHDRDKPLLIRITGDSVLEGDVVVDDPNQRVRIVLSAGGRVNGKVSRAEVIQE